MRLDKEPCKIGNDVTNLHIALADPKVSSIGVIKEDINEEFEVLSL